MGIGNVFPCRNCDHRHVGCHGSCEDYKAGKEEYDKVKARIRVEEQLGKLNEYHLEITNIPMNFRRR